MIKAILTDFSRTLLFPKDDLYQGSLNQLYKAEKENKGFNFFNYFYWNRELADYYKECASNLAVFIFTSDKIQEDPVLKPYLEKIFTKIFTLNELNGLKKEDSAAYSEIARQIKINPGEIVFIDDSELNIAAAKKTGLQTILHQENSETIQILEELIKS